MIVSIALIYTTVERKREKKPNRLCTPADKYGEEIKNDKAHLMCYPAKPATGEPKHVKVLGIHVNNQFGPEQLDTVKA